MLDGFCRHWRDVSKQLQSASLFEVMHVENNMRSESDIKSDISLLYSERIGKCVCPIRKHLACDNSLPLCKAKQIGIQERKERQKVYEPQNQHSVKTPVEPNMKTKIDHERPH